ncbi:preprotein translocase subunit SecA [Pilibacter termitis]|uniref:Protein translocase subunit SecA n=1 Tax=Pilibacter termitis TaxID=263852 RepID=A0A1T4NT96_9ENTE|nr:accessory Sec system translocase SecA2 [Pilibacter termitis]SJZ82357.1 preprotein translocase subunit SecA [Pilibacter termitis]
MDKQKKYQKIANKVMELGTMYSSLTDEELKDKTSQFRHRLKLGEKIDSLVPEAFATVVEANARLLGMKPYFVQILGAVTLFFGDIAEMKTGEGKTLTATMALYTRGLLGKGNFLITSNPYLAWRDAEEVGKVYEFLGLTFAVGVAKENSEEEIDKEIVYASDIVYTTHSALGFDYLFDNLATEIYEQYVTKFQYVLIDEIDSILLDMAQVPLVISGAPKVQSNLFELSNFVVNTLVEDEDYEKSLDEKNVWFLEKGILKMETVLGVEGLLTEQWKDLYRHLTLALRANHLLKNGKDYIVEDIGVTLLDEANGRKLEGSKLQAGFHQAIEAKENVKISEETRAMGTITYQNLFKKFPIISGMSGTAKTDEEEFKMTYNVEVIEIPTNLPNNRLDHKDKIFLTNEAKIQASLNVVKENIEKGRPILIGTGSVSISMLYSMILLQEKIAHNVLNATSVSKEKLIVLEAGKAGSVTVATSIAGRGTDIKLDDVAKSRGGLFVLGTERMTSERIDNQLRGRAGRQGEPGESEFFVSFEDKIVIQNAPQWVKRAKKSLEKKVEKGKIDPSQPLGEKYRKVIEKIQRIRKNQEIQERKQTLEFDMTIHYQREKIYAVRNDILVSSEKELDALLQLSTTKAIQQFLSKKENLSREKVIDFIHNYLDYNFDIVQFQRNYEYNAKGLKTFLHRIIQEQQQMILSKFDNDVQRMYYKRTIILKAVDTMWIEQTDNLQQLKAVISARSWGQKNPVFEFQEEAQKSFLEMEKEIYLNVLRNLLLSDLTKNFDGSYDIDFP